MEARLVLPPLRYQQRLTMPGPDLSSIMAFPLEINAYYLGSCFEADPQNRFSVENEVSTWIAQDRF
jgi:hypothetical protein